MLRLTRDICHFVDTGTIFSWHQAENLTPAMPKVPVTNIRYAFTHIHLTSRRFIYFNTITHQMGICDCIKHVPSWKETLETRVAYKQILSVEANWQISRMGRNMEDSSHAFLSITTIAHTSLYCFGHERSYHQLVKSIHLKFEFIKETVSTKVS